VIERFAVQAEDVAGIATRVRELVPEAASVHDIVAGIIASVREGGHPALIAHERRFGGGAVPLRVPDDELRAALAALDPEVRAGLELARANVARVAAGWLGHDSDVTLEQGHRVRLRELPVRRAGIYAPGGRYPYPSSVVMGVVTARVAGVEEVAVAAPAHDVMLAACALCGADEVYRMGGAQAVAALAFGTEEIAAVDVVAGPGNLYVQEAKRQVFGAVGIDGFAGPSDLMVLASAGADPHPLALDLLAQAEHGADSFVVAISDDVPLIDALSRELQRLFRDRDTVAGGPKVLVEADSLETALAFSETLAPEHLQLVGAAAEALAPRVTRAGCVFVGLPSATAFGDYVAGSNHTLPTDGAARFASGLNVGHFRRRMSEVHVGGAAAALAAAGVPIAHAERLPVHAESMEARTRQNEGP
jgi:histidinol dehydrogenase